MGQRSGAGIMSRVRHIKAIGSVISSTWSTAEDIILIENSSLNVDDLTKILPYSSEQIFERKAILGLLRREKYLKGFKE